MTSRKLSFFEFWRRKKERGEVMERASQLRLCPSQKRQLLSNSEVRAALQNTRMVSLLPPVGSEVFRHFTPASLDEIHQQQSAEKKTEVAEKEQPKAANHLQAGKSLPFIYEDPPPKLLNTPLEELDPFYQSQKTFVVLSKGNVIHRFNAEPACFLLSPFNPVRTFSIMILTHSFFSLFMLATILINCGFMMMTDGPAWTQTVEYVFMAIYTFEAMIKILAKGVCVGRFTFLRDPWDWLDIMVITTAYLTEFVDLRKVYVLTIIPRVLKLITVIPGLKKTVGAFVQSVKRLAGVIVLMAFCLGVLALCSMELFMGTLRQKCVQRWWLADNLTFDLHNPYDNETGSTAVDRMDKYYYYLPGQFDALLCGNSSNAGTCPEGFVCMRTGRNPNYGYTNYDSFGWSLLSHLRLLTQDFWENLVMLTLRVAGKSLLTFFVLIVFPGNFCVVSLILAVVAMAYGEREQAGVAEAKEREEEFSHILQVLKRSEEEEQAATNVEKQNGENMKTATEDHSSCPPCCLSFLRCDCCGCWRRLKRRLLAVITNPFFDLGIVICLIVNIIFIAMEHYPMTEECEVVLSLASLVFTAIFSAEMVLKLVALGPYGYFQVSWNIYDCIIVMACLLELALADIEGLSVLQLFDLLRIFRLARWWPALHMLMRTVWTTIRGLKNLVLLLLIAVFLFAVVGMHLFGQDYKNCVCRIATDCELPRWHMTNFFSALLIIIRVLFGEWVETMWDCMEVSGHATCMVFFITVMFIGNLLVLNLFLALLLGFVSSDNLAENNNNMRNAVSQIIGAVLWTKTWTLEHIWVLLGKKNHVKPDHTASDSKGDNKKDYLALNFVTSDEPGSEVKTLDAPKVPIATAEVDIEIKTPESEDEKKKHPEVQQKEDDENDQGNTPENCCSDKCYRCCPLLNIDTSQGGGRVWSNLRRACFCIVQHKYFEIFIIVIIVLSSTALMFEDVHLEQRPLLKLVVETADQVFTYLFLLEMLLKWMAFGLRKYFSSAWCWLDFLILDVFLVCVTANMLGIFVPRPVQSLRALGPLRAVSRFQGQRLVVELLVRTTPSMINGLLASLCICFVFSILGVQMFAGKFWYCFNETSETFFLSEVVDNRTECFLLISSNFTEVRWKNLELNFDNVLEGFLGLFVLAASASWMDILYAITDSRMVESQPEYESNQYMSLYVIFFIISSSFFIFNFLIRLLIDELQTDKFGGKHLYMTADQRIHCRTLRKLFPKIPQKPGPRPQTPCQARLFDLVTHPYYEVFMVVLICLNVVTLMTYSYDASIHHEHIVHWLQFIFIIIFLTEVILKVIALRQHYFSDGWNIVDFVVIIISIIGLFFEFFYFYFFSPSLITLLRLGRIGRVLHIIPFTRGIRRLLLAFVMSLPALFNFALLLLLLMVTFSIFGMFNFAHVVRVYMIDDMYNFETFGNSMISLFLTSTSSAWDGLLLPIMKTPPDCDPFMENPGTTGQGNCGSPALGLIFFIAYMCLSFPLLLHMFFAVILEVFNSEDTEALSDNALKGFHKTWKKFDPNDSQFIQYSKLSEFCDSLPDPMRIPKPNSIKLVHMDLPLCPGDKIHREDVLLALAAQVSGDSSEIRALKGRMEENNMADSPRVSSEPISSTLRRKREEVAAAVIQRAYRKGVLQHRRMETFVSEDGGDSQ